MISDLDPVSLKRLVLVKQIYQRSLAHAQISHSAVDRLLGVAGFDLANETALKAVGTAVELKNNTNQRTFNGLRDAVEEALSKKGVILPLKAQVSHVHEIRNDAQHKARYPNESETGECRAYTRDFLKELCIEVWGIEFEKISLTEAVRDEAVRTLLVDAEHDFERGLYGSAAAKASLAFKDVLGGFADAITERVDHWLQGFVVSKNSSAFEVDRDLLTTFTRMRDFIAFQSAGINLQEYFRFKRYTRSVRASRSLSGEMYVNFHGAMPDQTETEFILSFVTNAVILIESLDDEIRDPFSLVSRKPRTARAVDDR